MRKLLAVLMFMAGTAGAVNTPPTPPAQPTIVKIAVEGGLVVERVDASGKVINGQFFTTEQLQAMLANAQKQTQAAIADLQDSISKAQGQ